MTGIDLDYIPQQLEVSEERQFTSIASDDQDSQTEAESEQQFIIKIRGVKNRGATCYVNSLMQALASLEPLYVYLNSLQQQQQSESTANNNNDATNVQQEEKIALALLQTIQYVNGHEVIQSRRRHLKRQRRSFISSLTNLLSSYYHQLGDPQRIMNIVSKHYKQFRSNLLFASTSEQQDSHELFSALMDVLSKETVQAEEDSDGIVTSRGTNSDQSTVTNQVSAANIDIANPFDGLIGSTIKCVACKYTRPVRKSAFIALSLPIANIQSEFLEDFLATEYGGFATAEKVEDVKCFSCAIIQRINDLEEEDLLLTGAISSIERRSKKINGNATKTDTTDITGLIEESQQLKRKVEMLKTLDLDADETTLECKDGNEIEMDHLGINNNSSLQITPHRVDAYKASLLIHPPKVLCIHIQRRHFDGSGMMKVSRHVQFEEELDLAPYCTTNGKNSSLEKQSILTTPSSLLKPRMSYKLMNIIEHQGNAYGGHYQTYRRVNPNLNDWVLISDESIRSLTWDDVKKCQAYMLFYVAIDSTSGMSK